MEVSSKCYGKVRWFNTSLGYGFIEYINNETIDDIFFHYSDIICTNNFKKLETNDNVEFIMSTETNKAYKILKYYVEDEWEIL